MVKEFYIMNVLGVITGMNFSGMDGIFEVIRHCMNDDAMTDTGYLLCKDNATKIILEQHPDLLEDFRNLPLEEVFRKYSRYLELNNNQEFYS